MLNLNKKLSEERLLEISEMEKQPKVVTNWAFKVKNNKPLNEDEEDLCVVAEKIAQGVSNGDMPLASLSAFVRRSLIPEVENAPDEILDMMFERGTIGEFDAYQTYEEPVNTLNAIEGGQYGNVDKSFIDYRKLAPVTRHLHIATDTTMAKLRKGGYKSIAELVVMAEEALKNKMFNIMFNAADEAITQSITSAPGLTLGAMDDASSYLKQYGSNPAMLGLSSVLEKANRLEGYKEYMSEDMKNEINKYGILSLHNGVRLVPFKDSRKLADRVTTVFPSGKVLGIADKIGWLDMRGSLRIFPTVDTNGEKIDLKITGYDFTYCITKPENICKITISDKK